jgi:serine/threonine protein kinase
MLGLASDLEYIHSKNVIHADLSGANAIICKGDEGEESTKWVDFGGCGIDNVKPLACFDLYNFQPRYLMDGELNQATDILAFSCTVFEIETDAPPVLCRDLPDGSRRTDEVRARTVPGMALPVDGRTVLPVHYSGPLGGAICVDERAERGVGGL